MLKEFREFAFKGNLVDVAVGFVLGVAFNALVQSLADDILLQAIAAVFGEPDFSELTLGTIRYGAFLTALVNFVIVALGLFLVVRMVNRIHREEMPGDEPPPQASEEIVLLRQIRDALVGG